MTLIASPRQQVQDTAEQHIQQLSHQIESQGATSLLYIALGDAYKQASRFTDSLQQFDKAVTIDKFNNQAKQKQCQMLILTGDNVRCSQLCQIYIDFNIKMNLQQQNFVFYTFLGLSLLSSDVDGATTALFKAYELNPNFETKLQISHVQRQQEAVETLCDVLQFAPLYQQALLDLARIYVNLLNYDAAFDCYSRAVISAQKQNCPPGQAAFGVGMLLQNDEPRAALAQFRYCQQSGELWGNLASIFVRMGRIAAAVTCARRCFQLLQNDESRILLGQIYLSNCDFLRSFEVLSYFASGQANPVGKWLFGISAVQIGEVKLGMMQLAQSGQAEAGATLAGLKLCLQQKDTDMAKQFAVMLRKNDLNEEQKILAKQLVKELKGMLGEGVEEQFEGDEE